MNHSTAVEKLRQTILMDASRMCNGSIKTETYTSDKSIKSFFDSLKMGYTFGIKAVITITCKVVSNTVHEYFILCEDD